MAFLRLGVIAGLVFATACASSDETPPDNKVEGYDFDGFHIADAMPEGTICTFDFDPVQASCEEAHGTTRRAADCMILCSTAVAPISESQ